MGGVLPKKEKGDPVAAELAEEEAERKRRAKALELLRIQSLRRRRGGTVGQDQDEQQTIG